MRRYGGRDNVQVLRQYQRQGQVRSACAHSHSPDVRRNNETPFMDRVYVDDKYKIMYCDIPKVASTSWKRILFILSGKMNTTDPEQVPGSILYSDRPGEYVRWLSSYTASEKKLRIREYYKFMFVRDPLERLYSAYRNKFVTGYNKGTEQVLLLFGRDIIRRYRSGASEHDLTTGEGVTFREFVQYLLDPATSGHFNIHWTPYDELCNPCSMQYDFIGKYETFSEDANSVLEEVGISHLVKKFPGEPNTRTTPDLIKSAYLNVTSDQIRKLWSLYKTDFSMFDYPLPPF